jgi:hypothetical protein
VNVKYATRPGNRDLSLIEPSALLLLTKLIVGNCHYDGRHVLASSLDVAVEIHPIRTGSAATIAATFPAI